MNKRKLAAVLAAMSLATLSLSGCSFKTDTPIIGKIVGLKSDEIFKVEDLICGKGEYKLVLMNTANQYKKDLGSSADWNSKVDEDTTLENYVMEKVKEDISVKYTLAAMAESKEVTLTEEEKTAVTVAATEYYLTLTDEEKKYTEAEVSDVEKVFTNYLLADKVYEKLTGSIGDKISDEEARVAKIQYIRMNTDKTKESSIRSTYETVADLVKGGYQPFSREAKQYSEDSTIEKIIRKNEATAQYEIEAFNLNNGEISNIIQDGNDYYLVYCVESYLKDDTAKNKNKIIEKQKTDYFTEQYNNFLSDANTDFNKSALEDVKLTSNEKVTNVDLLTKYSTIKEIKTVE